MNINGLVQGLAGDILQAAQATLPGEPGQEGAEFEEMLIQQSQAAKPQRQESRPKEKAPANRQEAQKSQQTGTKDQEIAEEGQKVAAALVTSQPVVPIELVMVPEELAAGQLEGPALDPAMAGAVAWVEAAPVAEEPEALPQTGEAVEPQAREHAFQPQAPVQPEEAQPETAEPQAGPAVQAQPEAAHQAVRRTDLREEEQPEEVQVTDTWTQERQVFQRETAAPVKVADNYEEAETVDLRLVDQVQSQLSRAVQEGQPLVRLQLSPASLGQVTVEITRNADGALSILMSAATEKTAALLQRHGGVLQQALTENLQSPVQVEVRQPEQPENANQFLNPEGQNRQHPGQQQREKKQKGSTEDFLQQLRLGLIGLEEA